MIATILLATALTPSLELRTPDKDVILSLSKKEAQTCPFEYVNPSDQRIQVWQTNFWNNHQIELRRTDGSLAPLTKKGIIALGQFNDGSRDRNYPIVLQPGKSIRTKTPRLNEYFVLVPGRYKMIVKYSDNSFGDLLQATSKQTTIVVVE